MKLFSMILLLIVSSSLFAGDHDEYEKVWAEVRSRLANTNVDLVTKTRIDYLYALHAGTNIFYFDPYSKTLIFGDMLDLSDGSFSKTTHEVSFQDRLMERSGSAINLYREEPESTIFEFLSASCEYCAHYLDYIEKQKNIQRIVFFVSSGSKEDDKKLNHILCSETPMQDMSLLFENKLRPTLDCEAGRQRLAAHQRLAAELGVSSTPLLIIDGQRIEGFNEDSLNALLN